MARVARIGVGAGKTLDGHHAVFTYTGVNSGIPTENAPSIIGRSYTITAEVEVPEGGGNGMIAQRAVVLVGTDCTCSKASPCSLTTS